MGKSIIDKIQAKLELFRLEQRYTRRRHRRSTFVSNAVYVDGEYVYQTPNSTGSSGSSGSSNMDALHGDKASSTASTPSPSPMEDPFPSTYLQQQQHQQSQQEQQQQQVPAPERKRLNRFSSIPHFGGASFNKEMPSIKERRSSMIR